MKHATSRKAEANLKLLQPVPPVFDFRSTGLELLQQHYALLGKHEDFGYAKLVGVFSSSNHYETFTSSNPEWKDRIVLLIFVPLSEPERLSHSASLV